MPSVIHDHTAAMRGTSLSARWPTSHSGSAGILEFVGEPQALHPTKRDVRHRDEHRRQALAHRFKLRVHAAGLDNDRFASGMLEHPRPIATHAQVLSPGHPPKRRRVLDGHSASVAAGDHRNVGLLGDALDREVPARGSTHAQREVGLAPREVGITDAREHLQAYLGMPLEQEMKLRHQEVIHHARRCRNAHHALGLDLETFDRTQHAHGRALHRLGVDDEALGSQGRLGAVGRAIEQLDPELLLQRIDAPRGGGDVHAQHRGSPLERAFPKHRQEDA